MDITIRKQKNKKAWDVILGIETLKWLQIAGGDINSHLHICSWHNRSWHPTEAALKDIGKAWAKVLGKIPETAQVGAATSPIKKVK